MDYAIKVIFSISIGLFMFKSNTYAQYLTLSYSENFTGRSIKSGILLPKNIELGIRYHINKADYFYDRSFVYLRNFYAEKPLNHFGFYVLKAFTIKQTDKHRLSYFISADVSYMGVINHFDPLDSNKNLTYEPVKFTQKPFSSAEVNNGLTYSFSVNKKMQVFAQAGGGIIFIRSKSGVAIDELSGKKIYYDWYSGIDLWSFVFRAGLSYKIW